MGISPAIINAILTLFISLAGAIIWLWMARKYKEERLDKSFDELKEIAAVTDKSNELLRSQVDERNETIRRINARVERMDSYNRQLVRKVLVLETHVAKLERVLRDHHLPLPEMEAVDES